VDEVLHKMDRRCEVAESLLSHLESMVETDPRAVSADMAEKFESLAEASGVYDGPQRSRGPQPQKRRRKTNPRF
jgi:hypothetical protein